MSDAGPQTRRLWELAHLPPDDARRASLQGEIARLPVDQRQGALSARLGDAIAELAGVKVSDVRMVLKSTSTQPVAPQDARGASSGAAESAGTAAENGAPGALGVDGRG